MIESDNKLEALKLLKALQEKAVKDSPVEYRADALRLVNKSWGAMLVGFLRAVGHGDEDIVAAVGVSPDTASRWRRIVQAPEGDNASKLAAYCDEELSNLRGYGKATEADVRLRESGLPQKAEQQTDGTTAFALVWGGLVLVKALLAQMEELLSKGEADGST